MRIPAAYGEKPRGVSFVVLSGETKFLSEHKGRTSMYGGIMGFNTNTEKPLYIITLKL